MPTFGGRACSSSRSRSAPRMPSHKLITTENPEDTEGIKGRRKKEEGKIIVILIMIVIVFERSDIFHLKHG